MRILIYLHLYLLFGFATLINAQEEVFEPEDYGDRLKIGYVWQGDLSFNPININYDYDKELSDLLFGTGLFERDENDQIVNHIVQESRVLSPIALRLKIKSNLRFHDGSVLNALDIKNTFELYKKYSDESILFYNARYINSIEIYGSDIIRIKLDKEVPDFFETIGLLPVLPQSLCQQLIESNLFLDVTKLFPPGFGYFKFSNYNKQKKLSLESFTEHPLGQSHLQGIDFIFYENQELLLDAFLREEIDLIQIKDNSEIQKIIQFSMELIPIADNRLKLYYINLNTKRPPFDDIGIRRAINLAINKEQLRNYTLLKNDKSNSEAQNYFELYDYQPLDAQKILFSSGFRKNSQGKLFRNRKELQFELLIPKASLFEEAIARMISINLGEIGVNVIPVLVELDNLNKRIAEGNYQSAITEFNFNKKYDIVTLSNFYFNAINSQNGFQNFKSLSIELILDYAKNSTDSSEISTSLKRFASMLNRYSPCIFLFETYSSFYAIHPRFINTISTSLNSKGNLVNQFNPKHEWFVKKENHKY